MNLIDLINDTIVELARRPMIFSSSDVAMHADVTDQEVLIGNALQDHHDRSAILLLDRSSDVTGGQGRYIGAAAVELWWVERTLRWARTGINAMTSSALAREMALAFDITSWSSPPSALLEAGQRLAMAAEGYKPGTYVFPWAVVLRSNPACLQWFGQIFELFVSGLPAAVLRTPDGSMSLQNGCDNVLQQLAEREMDVVRARVGMGDGIRQTLEQVGNRHGVTRERIRQIEKKAWTKLRHPSRQRLLWTVFADDFIRSGGSLVIPESSLIPTRRFLHNAIGLSLVRIQELELQFIGAEDEILPYRDSLLHADESLNPSIGLSQFASANSLNFLSRDDGDILSHVEQAYRSSQASKTRASMLRDALRSLGRAAHYEDIAYECYKLFPECRASVRSLHAALSGVASPDRETFGIVWIGRRGMYGLKEHGYTRPDTDLFDAVATIVENKFDSTQSPVSQEIVITEISTQRRELKRNSVLMALAFNDRLEPLGRGEYIPKSSVPGRSSATQDMQYNIDAAFAAFSLDDDTSG